MLIEGIHHVCIKCSSQEQVAKVKEFYGDVLQMPMIRSWGEDKFEGCMFDTGAGVIEVIADATEDLPQGSIRILHSELQKLMNVSKQYVRQVIK